jgi:hypothetical protein
MLESLLHEEWMPRIYSSYCSNDHALV